MKITFKSKGIKFSIECDDSESVSIIANAKGRCWKYEVVGEVPREEQQDNILSKTAVDTRWDVPVRKKNKGSVEDRFDSLTADELDELALKMGVPVYWDLIDYLDRFTFREMRDALDDIQS